MGLTYVVSDIHGMAELLERMLERIRFSDGDSLFVLGDMIDRGPEPGRVLDIVRSHTNITALKGNHEDAFVQWYEMVLDKTREPYYYNTYTILSGSPEGAERLPEYVRFMKSLPLYKKRKLDGTCYLFAHASTEESLRMWKNKDRFLWDSRMTDRQCGIPGYISIVGHVPTLLLQEQTGEPARIWRSADGTLIDVDCGAAFPSAGGRLGCLCLETGEEFYVAAQ